MLAIGNVSRFIMELQSLGAPHRPVPRWLFTPGPPYVAHPFGRMQPMSQPLVVSIPHRLGREEAVRRIKSGLAAARTNYSMLLDIHEESWEGDRLHFSLSMLGQTASGLMDFADDHVRLEVQLPWLLAKIAEKLTPAIRRQTTLMLEKK